MSTYDQNSDIKIVHEDGDAVVARASLLFGFHNNRPVFRYVPLKRSITTGYNSEADYKAGKKVSFTEYSGWYRGGSRERPISFPLTPKGLREAVAFVNEHVTQTK